MYFLLCLREAFFITLLTMLLASLLGGAGFANLQFDYVYPAVSLFILAAALLSAGLSWAVTALFGLVEKVFEPN